VKLASAFLAMGAALLAFSLALAPYKDQRAFDERYGEMHAGQSEEYWRLRDEMLTPKFALQDYGVTMISLAIGLFLFARRGVNGLTAPSSRLVVASLAVVAPFLTVAGYIFDILQRFSRGEFPHWGDSIGIGLVGVPVLLVIYFVWALLHLAFLRAEPRSRVPLVLAFTRHSNPWLICVSALTFALVAMFLYFGQYWYAIPGFVWLYFYLSLAARRRVANGT
jgi:hypothetical protein